MPSVTLDDPATTATGEHAAEASNLARLNRAFQWLDMKYNSDDVKKFSKRFPRVAQDIRDGTLSPEEFLNDNYWKSFQGKIHLVGLELEVPVVLHALKGIVDMCFMPFFEDQNKTWLDPARFDFFTELRKQLQQYVAGADVGIDPLEISLKHVLEKTCRVRAPHIDAALSSGQSRSVGPFLLVCPSYGMSDQDFKTMILELIEGNKTNAMETRLMLEVEAKRLFSTAKDLASGIMDTFKTCWECEKPERDSEGNDCLKKCTQCRVALYCSKSCQITAWKSGHKVKCSTLKEKHEEFLRNKNEMDRIHKIGTLDGYPVSVLSDSRTVLSIENSHPPFAKGTELHSLLEGPSMKIFYENLRRIFKGEWWLYEDVDSLETYKSKLSVIEEDAEGRHFERQLYGLISNYLSYDFFNFFQSVEATNPEDLSQTLKEAHGLTMPRERYIELYHAKLTVCEKANQPQLRAFQRTNRRNLEVQVQKGLRDKFHK